MGCQDRASENLFHKPEWQPAGKQPQLQFVPLQVLPFNSHTHLWGVIAKLQSKREMKKWCKPSPWRPGLGFYEGSNIQGKVKTVGWVHPSCSANLPSPQTKQGISAVAGVVIVWEFNETSVLKALQMDCIISFSSHVFCTWCRQVYCRD